MRSNPHFVRLTQEDFQKVLLWEVMENADGDFFVQLRNLESRLLSEGNFFPRKSKEYKALWKWFPYYVYAHKTCINIETGEVREPILKNYSNFENTHSTR